MNISFGQSPIARKDYRQYVHPPLEAPKPFKAKVKTPVSPWETLAKQELPGVDFEFLKALTESINFKNQEVKQAIRILVSTVAANVDFKKLEKKGWKIIDPQLAQATLSCVGEENSRDVRGRWQDGWGHHDFQGVKKYKPSREMEFITDIRKRLAKLYSKLS